ncbi:MAG: TetR/AcrR family transcriptional regulator [Bacteroidaceae bacterium]|nr:TetR/AcrR family transcriptional regulator [Bacteroidaceae bacterium]MBO4592784.1 TetR/AcrR family transcriptional regulator [Bacteroidaceae bacterium]MBR4782420.1 TetR/AcrR family transcriptional regulator [Bacteroidaceae bacterium]
MSTTKTRNLLIDVARRLFAKTGLNGTTMNDIAKASGKGRRTLYAYFANKEEVYAAVIKTEVDRVSDKMEEVAALDMEPELKITTLIFTHLNMVKEAVVRNGNLRAEFFRNIWMVEKVRKAFDHEELELYRRVIKEGCEKGQFHVENEELTADVIHYCIKGLEVPYIFGRLGNGMTMDSSRPVVVNMVRRMLGVTSARY